MGHEFGWPPALTRKRAAAILLTVALSVVAAVLVRVPTAEASTPRHSGAQPFAPRAGQSGPASVSMAITVGYDGIYRGAAWTPVRITLRNQGDTDVSGDLEIPQSGQSAATGAQPAFHGLYQTSVVVPAGGAKGVTVYVPGAGVQGQVRAFFRAGGALLAGASASPIGVDTSALLIGVLARAPADMSWIAPAIQQQVTTHVIALNPATIDPVPQALTTFDIIVLTNADTSQLDRSQLDALQEYVRGGGSLLLIGGPGSQETLRPLPSQLLSGRLAGLRVLPDLHGLLPLDTSSHRFDSGPAAVSILTHPTGTVLASQAGVPLVVRTDVGAGTVEYLAFDPSRNSTREGRGGTSGLLEHLVAMAAPMAVTRTWSPGGFRARFQTIFRSQTLTAELANVPPATIPFLALFAALTLGYVLILGPANFLLLRRFRRQHLAWVTIPVLALVYVGSIVTLITRARASTVVLNTVGLITLGGTSVARPATLYLGLATSQAGTYQLSYEGAALPAPLPRLSHPGGFFFRGASTIHPSPLGMNLQEDPRASVTFLSMRRWSMRDLSLETSVPIPGTVQSDLTIDAHGTITGSIHNGTNLPLLDPMIVAGQSSAHLADIPVGGRVNARIRPGADDSLQDWTSFWSQLYGGPDFGNSDHFGGFRDCCNQVAYPQEAQLLDRIRNANAMLSQARPETLSRLGQVLLLGWSTRPVGTIHVDGSSPQRRDLNLIVTPLSVRFPTRGPFRLLTGTVDAHLVDVLPRAPQSNCCGFGGSDQQGVASVGSGGFLTFEFNMPANRHVRFQNLAIHVNSGDDGATSGRVYDWRTQRWIHVDLSSGSARINQPYRCISASGRIMVRLLATGGTGDLTVYDPYHDVQVSGTGMVT